MVLSSTQFFRSESHVEGSLVAMCILRSQSFCIDKIEGFIEEEEGSCQSRAYSEEVSRVKRLRGEDCKLDDQSNHEESTIEDRFGYEVAPEPDQMLKHNLIWDVS